jgi:hypothetical protein
MWVSRRWGRRDQLEDRVVFEAWRKPVDVEAVLRPEVSDADPLLRNEIDPDPLIEEMVARLRDGLSAMDAVDEWGRPMAWRNVVRLALGPLASKLRDTEQALELAVSMIPPAEEEERRVEDRRSEDRRADSPEVVEEPVAVAEPVAAPQEDLPTAEATVDVILPAADAVTDLPVENPAAEVLGHAILVEEPIVVDEPAAVEQPAPVPAPPAASPVVPVVHTTGAASIFTISGNQRAVPVSPLSPGQLLGGSGTDDTTSAKYDRFLTGLYGERKQMSADEDRRSRGTGLGDNL